MSRLVAITSGKGGVGKTIISVNMALHLAALGKRTCLFDADLGLANVNILLGLDPQYTLDDVISGNVSLQEVMIRDYEGLDIIPGGSGTAKLADLKEEQTHRIIDSFRQIDGYDFLLFDTSAGISRNVISFCLASSEVIVIITPEPTSLTDAYGLIKILKLNGFRGATKVIVNQCKSEAVGKRVFSRFNQAVTKYLQLDLIHLGSIAQDEKVKEALDKQEPLIMFHPGSPASNSIRVITTHLLQDLPGTKETAPMTSFWVDCLNIIKGPLKLPGSSTQEKKLKSGPASKHESPLPQDLKQELFLLMSRLVEQVSMISSELQLLRLAIDNGNGASHKARNMTDNREGLLPSKSIMLDLEGFIQKRKDAGSNA